MKSQNQPDPFLQVRRVLALKRHEQPPPGYFHRFSGDVVARIRAGDRADDKASFAGLLGEAAWLQRVWNFLENKPVVAGLFGAAVCALFLSVFVMSEKPDANALNEAPADSGSVIAALPSNSFVPAFGDASTAASSTDPLLSTHSEGSILDDLTGPKAHSVSWTVPGGN
jgi:hypothetical protein